MSALDQLPEYMRYIYRVLLEVYIDVEEELNKAGIPINRAQYAKDAVSILLYMIQIYTCRCVLNGYRILRIYSYVFSIFR